MTQGSVPALLLQAFPELESLLARAPERQPLVLLLRYRLHEMVQAWSSYRGRGRERLVAV